MQAQEHFVCLQIIALCFYLLKALTFWNQSCTHTKNIRKDEQKCKNIAERLPVVYDQQRTKEICGHIFEQNHDVVVIIDQCGSYYYQIGPQYVTLPRTAAFLLHRKRHAQKCI